MSTKTLAKSTDVMPFVMDDFFRPWNEWLGTTSGGLWGRVSTIPAANITETKDDYKLFLCVPGMKKSDFNIDIEGNMLTISAEREEKIEEKDENFTRKEYNFSSFSRSFTLPDEVNREKIDATYVDGVLKLFLPKKEEAKKAAISKHVEVK